MTAPLPRMRTAEGVMDIILEQDPQSKVTLYYLRGLIKSGKVPVTPVGRKRLVDADQVIEYIRTGERIVPEVPPALTGRAAIRRVEV